jgi:Flp pilus assembly CpaF family ATPase
MTSPPGVFGDPPFGLPVPWPDTGAERADEGLVRSVRLKVASELAQRQRRRASNGDAGLSDEDTRQLGDALIWSELQAHAKALLDQGRSPPSDGQDRAVHRAVYSLLFEFAGLQPHLDRADVVNVHAEGGKPVWLELTDGTIVRGTPVAASSEELVEFVRELGRRIGLSERRFDPDHYWVNLQLPDGSRLFAIAWVTREPHVFVRRHHLIDVTAADLHRNGAMSEMVAEFLDAAVRARFDLVIAGGQGDGKTTLLRALAAAIEPAERIVTIESDFELGLDHLPVRHHEVIALEAREANVEGIGRVSCAELVRRAMRMSARRIIVGEVLGDEVLPMLQAMNSGAKGSLCTVHGGALCSIYGWRPQRLHASSCNLNLPATGSKEMGGRLTEHERYGEAKHRFSALPPMRSAVPTCGPRELSAPSTGRTRSPCSNQEEARQVVPLRLCILSPMLGHLVLAQPPSELGRREQV